MAQLNDYLGFFDKVTKRLRNEEVTVRSPRSSRTRARTRPPRGLRVAGEAQGDARQAEGDGKRVPVPRVGDVEFDEEHRPTRSASPTRRARCARSTGRWPRPPESRQMLASTRSFKRQLQPPFLIEYAAKGRRRGTKPAERSRAGARRHRRGRARSGCAVAPRRLKLRRPSR
jgi:DNA gyrase subunit B